MCAPDSGANRRLTAERERELDRQNPTSTDEQPTTSTDIDENRKPMSTTKTDTDETPRLPHAATYLVEQPDERGSPINDDDPQAALELLRDRIMIDDVGIHQGALSRGNYKVSLSAAPDGWEEPSERAVHLLCITNSVVPDARDPSITTQTFATVWIEPVRVVREIVIEHFGADAFAGLTSKEEDR